MSETVHSEEAHAEKKISNPNYKVPVAIPVLIVLLLATMFVAYPRYQDYLDFKSPETVVKSYFDQVSAQDYRQAVNKLSVFFVAISMPEYSSYQPKQLIKARPEIINKTAQLMEENARLVEQQTIDVTVLPSYTKVGKVSAMVAFKVASEGREAEFGLAYLIKENGRFRIIGLQGIPSSALDRLKDFDIKSMDEEFNHILNS